MLDGPADGGIGRICAARRLGMAFQSVLERERSFRRAEEADRQAIERIHQADGGGRGDHSERIHRCT